ncbi:JAB domain-containing protein [Parasphingorhabdus halotolerans]|nr:JAB domain-containing protein [Parasphingorhabdus halotolerans]
MLSYVLTHNSNALILAHYHPEGSPFPSNADIRATRKISQVFGILKVALIDHIIFSPSEHFSFRDAGYL